MTPRQRLAAAAVLVMAVLVGVGGWLALGRDGGVALWSDGAAPDSDVAPDEEGAPGPAPVDSGRSGGDQAGSATSAPPRVHAFAEQPGASPAGPRPSPTAGEELSEGIVGCDYAYGDGAICVPWQFPDGATDKCGWLAERGFKPFPVNGRDRHGLDRNGDGIACGPGD